MNSVTIDNKKYDFNPNKLKDIHIIEKNMENDIFSKYSATAVYEGELIVCNDITSLPTYDNKIYRETYEEYMEEMKKTAEEQETEEQETKERKDTWIYNIIDKIAEQDQILFSNDDIIIIPTYLWNKETGNIKNLHILGIPTDKSLRTIRSLTGKDVPLLKHIREEGLRVCKNVFDVDETYIKMYFHYLPSTFHLHVHFEHVNSQYSKSSIEYAYELDSVIFNLELCSDYYQKVVLNKRSKV